MRRHKRATPSFSAGFTLIEMLVVLAIVAIIATILLVNNSRFNSSILLRSFAYEVGLSIRQAQLYGVSVKELSPQSGVPDYTRFNYPYGVHFEVPGSSPASYILFGDTNPSTPNGIYTAGADTIITTFTARNGFTVSDICALLQGDTSYKCRADGITSLDITFKRPDPEAIIKTNIVGTYTAAKIIVKSPGGSTREVDVSHVGQISIIATGN